MCYTHRHSSLMRVKAGIDKTTAPAQPGAVREAEERHSARRVGELREADFGDYLHGGIE